MDSTLAVILDVVSKGDEARFEVLGLQTSAASSVEVDEGTPKLFQLLVRYTLGVSGEDLRGGERKMAGWCGRWCKGGWCGGVEG